MKWKQSKGFSHVWMMVAVLMLLWSPAFGHGHLVSPSVLVSTEAATAPATESITTRRELERAIYRAWGRYLGELKTMLAKQGKELGGIAAAHEILGQPAEDAYQAFLTEQTRLNEAFGAAFDKKILEEQRAREAVANRTMAIKRAGQELAFAQSNLERRRIEVRAGFKAGVFTQEEVDAEIASHEQAVAEAQANVLVVGEAESLGIDAREKLIAAAMDTYTGPVNRKRGFPKRNAFRKHSGIVDATVEEIKREWDRRQKK